MAALLFAACSDDMRMTTDSGVGPDAGTDAFVTPPTAPMMPCPMGWSEAALPSGATFCEPWGEDDDTSCPAGSARFVGGAACEVVGPPCPAGDLPEDLPADATVLFVSTSAPPVGRDGSRERPFANLDEVFRAASGGEIFALGKGRHSFGGTFPEDTVFWGACAAETEIVAGFTDESTGTVTAHGGAHVTVRNATIVGDQPGFRVEEGATLEVHDVIVTGSGLAGAFVLDGTFIADGFVVRDSAPRDDMFGRAVQVQAAGHAEITRAVFERVHDIAVQVIEEGTAELNDVAIRDVTPDGSADLGRGIEVSGGGRMTISRVVIARTHDSGIFVGDGSLSATDVLIRGVRENGGGAFGRGLHLEQAGSVVASRLTIDDCRELGIYGSTEGSSMELSDLVVRRTHSRRLDGAGGRGVQFQWGITASIERAILDDNEAIGLVVASEGTTASATDTLITNTRENTLDRAGRGAEVFLGGRLDLTRVEMHDNVDIGYFVSGSTSEVHDLAIHGTQPQAASGWYGRGVVVSGAGASMTGGRVHLADNTELGMYVDEGSVDLDEVRIERTVLQPCRSDCMGKTGGIGLFVIAGGTATMRGFLLANNALAGLALIGDSRAPLSNGEIAGNPVGIYSSGDTGSAVDDLTSVELVDNQRNVDGMAVPIPDDSDPGTLEL